MKKHLSGNLKSLSVRWRKPDFKARLLQKVTLLSFATILTMTLVSCGGGDGASSGSSSSSSSSSSSASSSSGMAMVGDPIQGAKDHDDFCSGCHGDFDLNTGMSDGFAKRLDLHDYVDKAPHVLSDLIRDTMPKPPLDPASCAQTCADNVTAYYYQLLESVLSGTGGDDGEDDEPSIEDQSGEQIFMSLGCLGCHGNDGLQKGAAINFANYSEATMAAYIDQYMPRDPALENPDPNFAQKCVGECATKVAAYVWSLKPDTSCDLGEQVLPRRLRLLTKFEYVNTLNDLFGIRDAVNIASTVGSGVDIRGFDNNAEANKVVSTLLNAYWNTAKDLVSNVDMTQLMNNLNCGQQNAASCFVDNFGLKAFRRPLSQEEKSDYLSLFEAAASNAEGAGYVVQTMLSSPNFLYRFELGRDGKLTQYEIATLLAYTFWGTTPDDSLLAAASTNSLANSAQIKAKVEEMIASPKAAKQFIHFGRQWLNVGKVEGLDRDPQMFPSFTVSVAQAMDLEVDLFLQEMLLKNGYSMQEFFSWDKVFANNALASFYGLNGANDQMSMIDAGTTRGGVLRLGAVLARNSKFDESHPIKRGLLVRRNLLCQEFGPPPPGAGEPPPFDPSLPTRERFTQHSDIDSCRSCHQFIDEIGFASENYDAVGHYRTVELNGDMVDAHGQISGLQQMTGADSFGFDDLAGLSDILSTDGLLATSQCLTEQFHRMMDGVAEPDLCAVKNSVSRWNPQVNSIKDLWVEIVASQAFTLRQ